MANEITGLGGNSIPKMNIICCVCGVKYDERECAEVMDGKDSHGYCPKCVEIEKEKIDNYFDEEVNNERE